MTKKYIKSICVSAFFGFFALLASAQEKVNYDTVKAGIYDMGKMWTFDYPPMDYFSSTYQFTPDEKWFEEVRLSALRFANYCSASFVSETGLVMTNHHCARESGTEVQQKGEDFNANGFYAKKLSDERVVPGLYVDQLVKIEDITSRVLAAIKDTSTESKASLRDKEYKKIISEYQAKADWKNLEIQPVQFYYGGKYSLYGYKRYNDVRLVFMPELSLGFYGGDYDNFTYPRYNLDCSFFRVYDEHGKPLKTAHYYKFNPKGASENEPVFIIGNPGSTRRLSTVSDLEFNRDVFFPLNLAYYKNRSAVLQAYNAKTKNDSLTNIIFSMENAYKARRGELEGLMDPYLFARKAAFEKDFKEKVRNHPALAPKLKIWDDMDVDNAEAKRVYKTTFFFGTSANLMGNLLAYANNLQRYLLLKGTDRDGAASVRRSLMNAKFASMMEIEQNTLAAFLKMVKQNFGSNDPFVVKALGDKTPEAAAAWLIQNTKLNDPKVRDEFMAKDSAFIAGFSDPLLDLARISAPRYHEAAEKYKAIQSRQFANRSQLGNMLFELYGTKIPPDATFSLRINDGVVKGYEYNGTIAPAKTTYYGLYDRFYSFNKQYPWDLPSRWVNPPAALLPVSMNFVTTNDIIGGNSGSPMINKNREVIGLVFDGNMESLPGGFIYIPEANRSVGVTSPGMLGALKYIYKAKRLEKELLGK